MKRERTPDEDREFRAWIAKAKDRRTAPIERIVEKLGWRAMADDRGGPCPRPGCINGLAKNSDRFSINRRKNLFFCRASGAGGSPIDLVQHVKDMPFMEAVEFVLDEKPPILARQETPAERRAREERLEREERAAEVRRRENDETAAKYRENERREAFKIWDRARDFEGSTAEAYLAKRGLVAPTEARLRSLPASGFWIEQIGADGEKKWIELFSGPAMAAAGTRFVPARGEEVFSFLHRTWIDLDDPKGKKRIVDPKTGELLPAKKMRGSKKGASILLARRPNAQGRIVRWFMGEGIENTLAVWRALVECNSPLLDGAEFRAAGDLGNMSGKSARNVAHPTATIVDTKGRTRRKMVAGPDPLDPDPDPVITLGPDVCELWLIEDGSSEPFFTDCAIRRAAARFARVYPDLTIYRIKATPGLDHNDMLLRPDLSIVTSETQAATDGMTAARLASPLDVEGSEPKPFKPSDPRVFFEKNDVAIYWVAKGKIWQSYWFAPCPGVTAEGRRVYPSFDIRELPAEAYEGGAYQRITPDFDDFNRSYEEEKAYHRAILQRLIERSFDFNAECRRQWLILDPALVARVEKREARAARKAIEAAS